MIVHVPQVTMEELHAAEERLLEARVMLGKEGVPKPGEKIRGALGARMYATMVKRGIKITEVSNKKSGRIDKKEFRMTVTNLVPAALVEEVDALFASFDVRARSSDATHTHTNTHTHTHTHT
jgi:hypothetical protein